MVSKLKPPMYKFNFRKLILYQQMIFLSICINKEIYKHNNFFLDLIWVSKKKTNKKISYQVGLDLVIL